MEGTWYYVYILRSLKDFKSYVGFSRNLEKRLERHNNGLTKSTRNRRPFEMIYAEAFINEQDARNREKFYKTGRGREVLMKQLRFTLAPSRFPAKSAGRPTQLIKNRAYVTR